MLAVRRHFYRNGPSLFAQSFALRPVAQLMPNPRLINLVAREDPEKLGFGPELDRNDYNPPIYYPTGQETFSKRGGSVGYGGVYPIGNPGRGRAPRGPGGPPPPSGPDYGYGDYNRPPPSRSPPRGYNERASEDGNFEDGGDYGPEYDEYDDAPAAGGRQHHGGGGGGGGSGYESGAPNYDYGDAVQNGGYHFTGQNQEGDEHGRDSNNQYVPYDDSDNQNFENNHVYGSGNSDSGKEYGSGRDEYGSDSGGHYGSESGGGQYNAGGQSENSDNDNFENFEGFF